MRFINPIRRVWGCKMAIFLFQSLGQRQVRVSRRALSKYTLFPEKTIYSKSSPFFARFSLWSTTFSVNTSRWKKLFKFHRVVYINLGPSNSTVNHFAKHSCFCNLSSIEYSFLYGIAAWYCISKKNFNVLILFVA